MSNFKDVKTFMETFGQMVRVDPKFPDEKTMQLRFDLIQEELNELEEAMKNNYYDYFASDGFFWGQEVQEKQVQYYKRTDQQFLKAARKALKAGREVTYNCSW